VQQDLKKLNLDHAILLGAKAKDVKADSTTMTTNLILPVAPTL
jgi:hypothetical protein